MDIFFSKKKTKFDVKFNVNLLTEYKNYFLYTSSENRLWNKTNLIQNIISYLNHINKMQNQFRHSSPQIETYTDPKLKTMTISWHDITTSIVLTSILFLKP